MGRTVIPYTQVLDRLRLEWGKFRRGLRKDEQDLLDEVFDLARRHVAAGAYAAHPIPFETVMLSVLVEIVRRLRVLEARLAVTDPRAEGADPKPLPPSKFFPSPQPVTQKIVEDIFRKYRDRKV